MPSCAKPICCCGQFISMGRKVIAPSIPIFAEGNKYDFDDILYGQLQSFLQPETE